MPVEYDAAHIIALDVGGTSVKSGVIAAQEHRAVLVTQTAVDSTASAEIILNVFTAIIGRHAAQLPAEKLSGVALAFPGPFDYENGISHITGLGKYEALYGMNIRDELRQRLHHSELTIRFRNDAEAAIVGEARYGVGGDYDRVIGVTLGSGFGSAFLIAGRPQSAGAGVPPNGWLYAENWQGQKAEDCFSIKGLRARLDALGCTGDDPQSAAQRARAGDEKLREMFGQWGTEMGAFLRDYAAAFRADAVIVLGGISAAFDLFGQLLSGQLAIPVKPGRLGQEAALLGAADLILRGE
jgi:glucokinase